MLYIRKNACYRRFKHVIRLLPCVLQIKERQIGLALQLECVDSSLEFGMTVKELLRHAPDKAEFPDLAANRLQLLLQGGNLSLNLFLFNRKLAVQYLRQLAMVAFHLIQFPDTLLHPHTVKFLLK